MWSMPGGHMVNRCQRPQMAVPRRALLKSNFVPFLAQASSCMMWHQDQRGTRVLDRHSKSRQRPYFVVLHTTVVLHTGTETPCQYICVFWSGYLR